MSEHPTVYIVDDDHAVLKSMKWLLESEGYRVDTESSPSNFLERANRSMNGCLLLDIRMPDMDGLTLQKRLLDLGIDMPVVIISGHADVSAAVKAMKTGAIDLLEKPFADREILERVDRAMRIEERRKVRRRDLGRVSRRMTALTRREREVMELVVAGNSNKRIAEKLCISNKTVEAHRAKVMKKMEATSLAELVRDAILVSG